MTRLVLLASSLAVLPSVVCGCEGDGLQATVGVLGRTCLASVSGNDPCGPNLACGGEGRCVPAGYVLITPRVEPLSETSVQLTWSAAATGAVAWYEVRVASSATAAPAVVSAFAHVAPSVTSVVLSDLAPGTLGRVVVAAAIPGASAGTAASSVLWTPFGAINEDSVNSVTPLSGYAGAPYAEGMFVSSHFSMFFAHAYLKESSFVFDGIPSSQIAKPIYNFASPVIKYANGFAYPDVTDVVQIWSDGVSRVLISNDNQNRVLVYDHLPLTPDDASPDRLLGQTTWAGLSGNDGEGSVNARGFGQAGGACFNGTTLYVRDNTNSRILGWHGWPAQMGQAADFVLGQPDFGSSAPNNGGISKETLSLGLDAGKGLDCRGGRLVMADTGNHRVLVWNVAPTQGGAPADIVLGQSTGNQGAAGGAGGSGVGGLIDPESVASLDGGGGRTAIVVADGSGNRVVEWDDVPQVDGAPFDRVYGQPDRTTTTPNTGGLSSGSLDDPLFVTVDDENRFWVGDFGNGRALRFDLDSPAAIGIFGQRSGSSIELFPGSFSPTRSGWDHYAEGELSLDPTSGLFTTSFLERGMFWDSPPRDGQTPATAIQGQPDATTCLQDQPTSPTSLAGYGAAARIGNRVYWSDTNRILSMPGTFAANNAIPDVVLGNQDFQGNTVAPTTLDYAIAPSFLATDGQRLLAVDGARIVGWSPAPQASHASIDFAIGQPSLLVDTANNGGVSAHSLGGGRNALTIAEGKLIVADPANNRVLVWNEVPSVSDAPADVVLGQPDFVSSSPGAGAQMNAPSSVAVLDGNLVVSDTGNGRLLVFNGVPTTSGVAATILWDPRIVRFSLPAWFDEKQLTPHDLAAYQGRLYVGQTGRILVLPDLFVK